MVQVLRKKQKDLLYHKFIYLGVTSKFKPFYLRVLGGLMVLETDPDTEVIFGHFKVKVFFSLHCHKPSSVVWCNVA